jgi:hypothetical protein
MPNIIDELKDQMSPSQFVVAHKMVHEYGVGEDEVLSILRERGIEIKKYIDQSVDANAIVMELLNKED